ncbi:hypothetical protein MTBBW1_50036 [Desulfamplus magnetovallimortis]|uniref:Uncharacterized protein n=1 Tax=Desulfamplus magnetovallimortis TaxID=1246637 RepID=A0A1W1HHK4_9BACT|nr:hypothetical protein MTBBW1_50036 [Desulfamplus magnetovallimortis]
MFSTATSISNAPFPRAPIGDSLPGVEFNDCIEFIDFVESIEFLAFVFVTYF